MIRDWGSIGFADYCDEGFGLLELGHEVSVGGLECAD